ncbi:MAG: capsule biosynthesis protein [Nitrospirae bacterium]|nr:capsule biosynthesis protein [Nitrospirota bacterium]
MATSLGGYDQGAVLESALAVALTLRGARVDMLLCDEFLPSCQMTKFAKISPEDLTGHGQVSLCRDCFSAGRRLFEPLGLSIQRYSKLVGPEQVKRAMDMAAVVPLEEIGEYKFEGLAVGEQAMAGALRYYGRGDLGGEPLGEAVLRRYLEASLMTVFAVQRLIEENAYDVACFHHGIYVPQGIIGEVCRKKGLRIVNWNPSYRKQTFIFSHGDSYHHTMITETVSTWQDISWTPETERMTLDYLKSRWQGTGDWIWFHESPREDLPEIIREVGIDTTKPWIGMLTSVMWDAQLHYRSNAFPNQLEWVMQTIRYFARRPELQLIIRIHPAEVRGMVPSRQPIAAEIRSVFPSLPPNVFVIHPESHVSTYAVMEHCDSVIIYNTKTGIELSGMGIPVLVAGEAWIRNKGFSLDATDPEGYFKLLEQLPLKERLSEDKLILARKYAFHFFFRRMIPLPFITSPEKYAFSLNISGLDELMQGRDPGLDVICDGILNNRPFIYPAERLK